MYESVADATASWRRGSSPAGTSCLRTFLRRGFAKQGIRLVSFGKMAFPRVANAQRTLAFRAELSATTPQGTVPATVDVVVLGRSRAPAQLIYASAVTGPDLGEEVRLARLVADRMARAMR